MKHPNDQGDGFYDIWYCASESDGSQCTCGKGVHPQPPMGLLSGKLIRTVTELQTMPYGMRLSRGFAILSGNKHDL